MKSIAARAPTELALRNRHPHEPIDGRQLRRLALAALREPVIAPGDAAARGGHELSILIVDGQAMTALNRRWLGHEGSTDVITFAYPPPPGGPEPSGALRGDLVISLDDAARQARRFRTTREAELARCLVHGLLHLRGYRDATPPARRRMKLAEDRVLRNLARRFDWCHPSPCATLKAC